MGSICSSREVVRMKEIEHYHLPNSCCFLSIAVQTIQARSIDSQGTM